MRTGKSALASEFGRRLGVSNALHKSIGSSTHCEPLWQRVCRVRKIRSSMVIRCLVPEVRSVLECSVRNYTTCMQPVALIYSV